MQLPGSPVHLPTHLGTIRGRSVEFEGVSLLLLSRHSAGHKVPPHKVNYAGMALALRQQGVPYCMSSAAVGSLNAEFTPGTLVCCSDFLDFTFRNITMFSETVKHTDFSHPFSPAVREAMQRAASDKALDLQPSGTYLAGNGPRYETPAEIEMYAKLGADLVGMTATSEAIVMREAGIEYGCLAVVSNMAAGISPNELSHQEVEDQMKISGEDAIAILLGAAKRLAKE
jgi:5'-methylthioadenosine phosphorylase